MNYFSGVIPTIPLTNGKKAKPEVSKNVPLGFPWQTKLHSSAPRSSDAEETIESLEDDNRSLKSQLEESRRAASRLTKERDELSRRLEERDLEREALRRGKTDLEEQKRLLDRALEKMTKEVATPLCFCFFSSRGAQEAPSSARVLLLQMEAMMGESRQSVVVLQTQLDDYRERSRKDLQEAQRTNKERLAELQRVQSNLKAQQEEVSAAQTEMAHVRTGLTSSI